MVKYNLRNSVVNNYESVNVRVTVRFLSQRAKTFTVYNYSLPIKLVDTLYRIHCLFSNIIIIIAKYDLLEVSETVRFLVFVLVVRKLIESSRVVLVVLLLY